jgi:hypothetical protein
LLPHGFGEPLAPDSELKSGNKVATSPDELDRGEDVLTAEKLAS